ncbi:MAG TPA: antibiotic biosynthesis monooxygenase, partial [Gemmatimonadaceae bacterium]
MFSVIFEVAPRAEQWDAYLANAKMLRPELEQVDGFIDNIRYKSLTRDGWILSLSNWRDEKAVVRWRTAAHHHEVQEKGRTEILANYHLRVGQITDDTRVPDGYSITEQRLDETEVGDGTTVILIGDARPHEWRGTSNAADCAEWLGLDPYARDMVSWDVFEAVLTPGELIMMLVFKDRESADRFSEIV